MPAHEPDRSHRWARALIDELVQGGVDTLCLAPGSRSTPLVAAAVEDGGLRIVTHVDERGAAFYCVGYARATGRPAAWLTTSGTAVANGLPAVVEASQDGVPMVLLTADRPPELRGTGSNQTITQPNIFGVYPRFAVDLPVPEDAESAEEVRPIVRDALFRAMTPAAGPVHLNCPFRKPLEPEAGIPPAGPRTPRPPALPASTPDVSKLVGDLQGHSRGVVLAGRLNRSEDAEAAASLARHLCWPLLPDVCSQLRLGPVAKGVITHADLLAGHIDAPEAVIQVGRMPVSQRLTRYLAAGSPAVWAVLADGGDNLDPHGAVSHRLADAGPASRTLEAEAPGRQPGEYTQLWQEAQDRVMAALPNALGGLTEPAVAADVAGLLPAGHGLVLASSMPIRDVNSFAGPGARPTVVAANRGASGIDGTIATAAGVADGLRAPVTLLIGDLALLHDLNSLAFLRTRPVTVVVINNDGGGIFSFLPIAEHKKVFESYFGVPHGLRFEAAARLFGLAYAAPDSREAFQDVYRTAVAGAAATIIEVRTDRAENRAEHSRLGRLVAEWVR